MILPYIDNKKDGAPVLFIHGTGAAKEAWKDQVNLIGENGYRGIAVDLRGHGEFSFPEDTKTIIDDHLEDLGDTLNQLNINEPITAIGHSFGAVLSVKYAEKEPSKVNKLMLVGLPPKLPKVMNAYYTWLLGKPIELLTKDLSWTTQSGLSEKYKRMFSTDVEALRMIFRESQNWNFIEDNPKISCKTHMSVGRFDNIALSSSVKRLHKKLTHSNFKEFKWAGHCCMEDQPNEFNKWLLSSLES